MTQQICADAKASGSCDTASMELAILLDGSDSVGNENFEKLKTWTNEFIGGLEVQKYGTQVGVIKYATIIRDISPLSSNIDEIKARVRFFIDTRNAFLAFLREKIPKFKALTENLDLIQPYLKAPSDLEAWEAEKLESAKNLWKNFFICQKYQFFFDPFCIFEIVGQQFLLEISMPK